MKASTFILPMLIFLGASVESAAESLDPRAIVTAPFHSDKNNCKKCHIQNSSKSLIKLTGEPSIVEKTPEICGQCHGIMKRNWEVGTHGKRINSWTKSGEKLICTKCHDPHKPKFPKFVAKPPPKRPKFGIPKGHEHE